MPEAVEEQIIESMASKHPNIFGDARILSHKQISVRVRREDLINAALYLRDSLGFTHPISAGGIDWLKENRMEVIYYLLNPENRVLLMLRIDLPRDHPRLSSMTGVWEAFNFHEREAREMFGIEFEGHPNPVNLLLPPDWRGGFPLRKDFKGEGVRT
ncbi:NADH-quinone oxidoreductase subunit C [Candidatus Bathyarchaeota archaeon]|nr:NADH-quinone oxidoreductase subunit C [Candidatus Bathyarchaeota archaeon]MBS7630017.1 NADH-quinone oxidoreductase subunit C [Candidatus Bathyarchaeota archaeon]